jgi:predicted metalloprotease
MHGVRRMQSAVAAVVAGALALGACGGSEGGSSGGVEPAPGPATVSSVGAVSTQPIPAVTSSAPIATAAPTTTDPGPSAEEILQMNALYQVGAVPPAGCAAWSQVELGTFDGVRAFYESVVPCLDAAWAQVVPGLTPALLTVFTGPAPADSCSPGSEYSFYCPGNGTIFMYADEMIAPWNQYAGDEFSHGITRLAAAWVIAHEYGHHLQNVAGIFGALEPDWPGSETERRLELQASCLADVFLSSQRDAYPVAEQYWEWQDNWRATRLANHGSPENHRIWVDRGRQGADPGACNAFAAPSADVT